MPKQTCVFQKRQHKELAMILGVLSATIGRNKTMDEVLKGFCEVLAGDNRRFRPHTFILDVAKHYINAKKERTNAKTKALQG